MAGQEEAVPSVSGHDGKTPRMRRKFILCFDGTGNKFQGTAGDSNSELSLTLWIFPTNN